MTKSCLSDVSEDQGNLKADYSKNNMFVLFKLMVFPDSLEPKNIQQIDARQIGEIISPGFRVEQINKHTPPKFNMEPENDGFQKGISFSRYFFSGSMLNFRGVFGTTSCGYSFFSWEGLN